MKQTRTPVIRMLREVRKAEAIAHEANLRRLRAQEITGPVQDAGTGQTILKLKRHQPPLATLADGKKISALELQAAAQIELAAFSVATGGILRAVDLQRVDRGRQGDNPWPHHIAMAVRNYQSWQNHWSAEWKRTRNPMLEIIWSAVIDERPLVTIAQEIGYGRHLTTRGVIAGLRHYAAWANMITGTQADRWLGEAQHVFDRRLLHTTS
jgi:hypothetical protein